MRLLTALFLVLALALAVTPASAKKKPCRDVRVGQLCVKRSFSSDKGSIAIDSTRDSQTRKRYRFVSVDLADRVDVTCSGEPHPAFDPQHLVGTAYVKGSTFSAKGKMSNRTVSIKGAYKGPKKAVIKSSKVVYEFDGVVCTAEATDVTLKG